MGVQFSDLPIASTLASDDYLAVLKTQEGVLKRTAVSNLGGKGVRASYDETTALYAHAVDDIIYVNQTLYKVTSAIAVGDTIAVGTNVTTNTDITADSQIYMDNLPGSGGGGGSVDVDDEFDPESTNPIENGVLTSTIAPTEATSTATAAHAVGTAFFFGGQLVKATSAIAVNDTIVLGTNVVATTLVDLINTAAAAAQANYSNIATDPASTEGMNIWIETQ